MAVAVGTRSGLAQRGLLFYLAADGGYAWLAVLAVANTVASLFYYLRWLAPLFQPAPGPLLAEVRTAGPPLMPRFCMADTAADVRTAHASIALSVVASRVDW
jgi:NADH:ubiquinone oxidoreductase subunit 2 (subunit N)